MNRILFDGMPALVAGTASCEPLGKQGVDGGDKLGG